jgi:hypothetical protein
MPDERALYEKKKHVALSNLGRRGGKRSVIRKVQDGSFKRHMYRMTVRSSAARKRRALARKAAKPSFWIAYRCPRPSCQHYWRGRKTTAPKQCPKCGLRLASKRVKQLNQANLRMYPDEIVQKDAKIQAKALLTFLNTYATSVGLDFSPAGARARLNHSAGRM